MTSIATVANMVRDSEQHADDLSADRLRATEYYRGVMADTPADAGRSQMVTRDVRAQIKKVLPSVMRTIFAADEVVEFQPVAEGDEDAAQQASDYVNRVVMAECNARDAIYDAIHDALLLRNGILKWWHDEKPEVSISKHSGLTQEQLADLAADDDVEVLEHDEAPSIIEIEGQPVELMLHSVKIRRTTTTGKICAAAVPRERFLIHPDAVSIEDSLLTGEKTEVTRSDLVAMGYDRKLVDGLSMADEDDEESDTRRDVATDGQEAHRPNEAIDYYDLYIRVDMDGDGIAELRHMVFAGGLGEKNLLEDDEVDEVQFCDVCVMRQPHQWEGTSLFDDLHDIQRTKTSLLRQTLDNFYWQNNPQPIVQQGIVENLDAVMSPDFGAPIFVKRNTDVRAALGFTQTPFVAADSFGMMEYMDAEAQDRTGVSDASAGLAPDALQNMTAKASAMIEQAGIGQTEMMVRNVAEGLRTFFRGILRLSIRHQDIKRTVRLRDEWVDVDPSHWNAGMDCTVNTGLGAGTRERDMMMMQQVIALQEKLLAGFGPDNPFVKPENVSAAIIKLAESAGLKTPALYFNEPDEGEVEGMLEKLRNRPDPKQMEMQANMELEKAKLQADEKKAQMQVEVSRDRERAQMEADLTVKQAEIAADKEKQADKLASDAALLDRKLAFEREKLASERQDKIWQAQAASMETEKQGAAQ